MKVKELINELAKLPPNAEIKLIQKTELEPTKLKYVYQFGGCVTNVGPRITVILTDHAL